MARRRTIGIIYNYNENWIGGTYYIQNLISAMNLLDEKIKPQIFVVTDSEKYFQDLCELTNYGRLFRIGSNRKLTWFERRLNQVCSVFLRQPIIGSKHKTMDLVFPAYNESIFSKNQKFLYWIPDFQEHYLPQFFTEEEVLERKRYQKNISEQGSYIVFSSRVAFDDFILLYPESKIKKYILNFAVTHPALLKDFEKVRQHYKIPPSYFICSNQFWKHKNHQIVLNALSHLKGMGIEITVVFTGKENDYRNPDYFQELKHLVEAAKIETNALFVGFISREDQLLLMQNAIAIIQPSLFEGWSTVIEDAKALNVHIIASSINVHLEQLEKYTNAQFFESENSEQLSQCILHAEKAGDKFEYDYNKSIKKYAEDFMMIVDDIANNN